MEKSIINKDKMISGAIGMVEAVAGGAVATFAINKTPSKVRKFAPGLALAGSLATCLLTDNTHARSVAFGAGLASSMALVKQFTEDKPATATAPSEQSVSGLAGIKGVLKSAFIVDGGFSEELGDVADMEDDYMVDNFITAYQEHSRLTGVPRTL
jgi:hypothetical protein